MFFLGFLGRPGRSMGWAHMQSVRAGAVETHFAKMLFWLHFGSYFHQQSRLCLKKRFQKSVQKKGASQDANSPQRGAMSKPGGSLTDPPYVFDCSNKKQQFEQEITTDAQF